MSTSLSPHALPSIITELRAAGCVYAEDEARMLHSAARSSADLDAMVARHVDGVPLEHVLGWAEFCELRIAVDAGVFIPRRHTEFLIHHAADLIHPAPRCWAVVDLCCGSGAVGAALVNILRRVELHAVDIDLNATRCARRNLTADSRVYEGALHAPLPATVRSRVDILVAIAPYVPTGAIELLPREARLHEPRIALDGGPDGLDVARRVIAAAPQWLAPGGHLMIETSERQAPVAVEAISHHGLIPHVATSNATVVIGTRPRYHDSLVRSGA